MKVIKKVLLGLGMIAGITTITACSNGEGEEVKEITKIDMTEDIEEYTFSEILLDSSTVQKTFYLGDEFNYDGLKVTAVYSKTTDDIVESRTEEIDTFTVSTELVDMNTVGRYIVIVNGRSGMSTKQATYAINVLESEQVASNKEYLAGLDLTLAANANYEIINTHTLSIKIDTEFTLPTLSQIKVVYFTGSEESRNKNVISAQVKIDSTKVDTSKKGSYPITYTYTEGGVTVKNFILVVVSNPVVGIEFVSGSLSQSANVTGYDYSDWLFKLTEESGSTFEQTYDPEYFTITGVDTLMVKEHTATVSYYDNDMVLPVSVEQKVTVTEAVGYNIVFEKDFGASVGATLGTRVKIGDTNYFHYTSSAATLERDTQYDNNTFNYRATAGKGSKTSNNVEIYMPNAGTIVLYFGTSSGGNARTVECLYEDGEVVGTVTTANTVDKAIFEVNEAGTYYFYSQGSSLYYYGMIIAYALEGAVEPDPAGITDLAYVSGTTDYLQNGSKDGLNNLKFEAKFDDNTSKIYTLDDEELTLSTFDNTVVGNQTLTVTFDDGFTQKTCELPVTVTDVTLSNVVLKSGSTTQRMSMGGYDVSDFVLTASYSDGSAKDVTFTDNAKYTLSYEVDNHSIGQKTMTITFVDQTLETKTITVDVTLIEMASTNKALNTSSIGTLTNNSDNGYTSNGFTISTATNKLADDNKSLNGFSFTTRLQLYKIDGLANYISFETTGPAKLVVYARGGGAGKSIYVTESASAGAYGDVIYALSQSDLGAYEFNITEAGTYYLVSDTNYSSIYYLGLEYDQASSTSTTADIESVNLYSATGTVTNQVSVTQNDDDFDINDLIFTVTYSDGCVSYIKASDTTFVNPNINLANTGNTSVSFTYEGKVINVTISVVAATN